MKLNAKPNIYKVIMKQTTVSEHMAKKLPVTMAGDDENWNTLLKSMPTDSRDSGSSVGSTGDSHGK